jgi:O-antigen ligase
LELKAITAIIIACFLWRTRTNPWRYPLVRVPLIFLVYTFLVCFRFHDRGFSLSWWLRATYWIALFVFFYVVGLRDRGSGKQVLWLWRAAFGALVLLVGSSFLAKAMGIVGDYYNVGEVYGFYSAPSNMAFGLATLVVVPLMYALIKGRQRTTTVLTCGALVVCTVVATYMTMVRASLVCSLVALLMFGFAVARGGSRKALVIGLIALVISVGAVVFVYNGLTGKSHSQVADRWSETEKRGDIGSGRLLLWYTAYSHFQSTSVTSKLVGEGFGISYDITEEFLGTHFVMHNDVIEVLLAGGIFGVALYVMMFVGLYRPAWREMRRGSYWGLAAFLSLVVYTLSSLTTTRLEAATPNTYFALIAGTSLGMLHRNTEHPRADE